MWISKPVYTALPAVYLVGGIAAIAYSGNVFGVSFGVLLALVGAVIWRLRGDTKTRSNAHPKKPARRMSQLR